MPLWMPRSSCSSPRFSARSSAVASSCDTSVKTAMSPAQDVPDALLAFREAVAVLRGAAARHVRRLDLVRRRPVLRLHGHALRLPAHAHLVDPVVLVLGGDVLDLLVLARIELAFAFDGGLGEGGQGAQKGKKDKTLAHSRIVG